MALKSQVSMHLGQVWEQLQPRCVSVSALRGLDLPPEPAALQSCLSHALIIKIGLLWWRHSASFDIGDCGDMALHASGLTRCQCCRAPAA